MKKPIIEHLSKDAVLRPLLNEIDWPIRKSSDGDLYRDLIRSIVGQQLSIKAAQTIYNRFLQLFEQNYPHPEVLIKKDQATLRSAGLSRQKSQYLKNVAQFFLSEDLLKRDWSDMQDESIVKYLSQIKGVGTWTVQMILMFTLERPDVFPVDDLGIRNSMIQLYDVKETGRDLKPALHRIAEPWRPYRTYGCRYLWAWKN